MSKINKTVPEVIDGYQLEVENFGEEGFNGILLPSFQGKNDEDNLWYNEEEELYFEEGQELNKKATWVLKPIINELGWVDVQNTPIPEPIDECELLLKHISTGETLVCKVTIKEDKKYWTYNGSHIDELRLKSYLWFLIKK